MAYDFLSGGGYVEASGSPYDPMSTTELSHTFRIKVPSGFTVFDEELFGRKFHTDVLSFQFIAKFRWSIRGVGNRKLAWVTNIEDGKWHDIALTWEGAGGAIKLYVDGVLEDSDTMTGTISGIGAFEFQIGRIGSDAEIFTSGLLHDVRVYDVELTAAEAAVIAHGRGGDGIVRGLQSRFMLDELYPGETNVAAGVAKDIGPLQNHGTCLIATAGSYPAGGESESGARRRTA